MNIFCQFHAKLLLGDLKFIWVGAWQNQQNDLCAQQRLRDHLCLSAWRTFGSLAMHKVQLQKRLTRIWADAQANLSLRWVRSLFCLIVPHSLCVKWDLTCLISRDLASLCAKWDLTGLITWVVASLCVKWDLTGLITRVVGSLCVKWDLTGLTTRVLACLCAKWDLTGLITWVLAK